jgi:hypothetical protein
MRRFLGQFSSAPMIVSVVALLVALSGSSYAAAHLGHGSVRSVQTAQPTLRAGETMRGYFAGGGGDSTGGTFGEGITFPKRLPGDFHLDHVQYVGGSVPLRTTAKCPGAGTAKRGWMCFYEERSSSASLLDIFDQHDNASTISPYGLKIFWLIHDSDSFADGQWVVRAP